MSLSASSLAQYWRSSLSDSTRQIDPDETTLYELALSDLQTGTISSEVCELLWKDAEASMPDWQFENCQSIPALIAPVLLRPAYESGKQFASLKGSQVPLWIIAQCDRQGKVSVNVGKRVENTFIVSRNVMAPLASSLPTFTSVEKVDRFYSEKAIKEGAEGFSWKQAWDYTAQLFQDLFATSPSSWPTDRMFNHGAMIAYGSKPIDASGSIRDAYERITEADDKGKEIPALFCNIIEAKNRQDACDSDACHNAKQILHIAQMGGEHPLKPGQREALSAVLAAPVFSAVAVNGPPGTGKTTLIQSVVASLWVKAAVKEDVPPVILASSANNQAITNILDTFTRASLPEDHRLSADPLTKRWIPKVGGYGLYLPSDKKSGSDAYQNAYYTNRKEPWRGLPELTENKEFVDQAKRAWTDAAMAWDVRVSSIKDGVSRLHKQLVGLDQEIGLSWKIREGCTPLLKNVSTSEEVRARADKWSQLKTDWQNEIAVLNSQAHVALACFHGLEGLLSWIPFFRRRIWGRVYAHLSKHKLSDKSWTWETVLNERQFRAWLIQRQSGLAQKIDQITPVLSNWDAWRGFVERRLSGHAPAELLLHEELFQQALDVQVRVEMFFLAGRYWEGRWILEMEDVLAKAASNPKLLTGWSRDNCEARWRRYSMLTPCLVSTVYTAPRVFGYYNGDNSSLFSFIDLLIVEEAGQVAPQTGAALFAFARRAMIVGDTQQIEPVWGVTAAIDEGNLALCDLDVQGEELRGKGMTASEGSVMRLAQAATCFSENGHEGMFLSDHFRCRPSTIAFCNELAYRGELKPVRGDGKYLLPPLGYANVYGAATKRGTSWCNKTEADIIAAWIRKNKEALCNGRSLAEAVAIVTPFRAQISVLQSSLKQAGLGKENIVVGTIHALQGAEKDIVIFSSVYSADTASGLFFDNGVNMLNVAVSRAKNSFLVFGDMRIFRPERGKVPSGLLAKYLFSDPAEEITDIEPTALFVPPQNVEPDVQYLRDHDVHRDVLRQALERASDRVLIVSPYLSIHAIDADNLLPLFQNAISRGVRVVIAYDPNLNKSRDGSVYSRADKALTKIKDVRVELWPITPAHNKTLAVDGDLIVEGSFNWLSATREKEKSFHRYESSMLYQGRQAKQFIDLAWEHIEKLRVR